MSPLLRLLPLLALSLLKPGPVEILRAAPELCVPAAGFGTGLAWAQEIGPHLDLMTFNIRYGSADDGPNAWPNRKELVGNLIGRHSPDVLALQEGLAFQLDDLAQVLGGYRKLGQHRDGGLEGEFSGLYVTEERVRILDWGELWLSPTPDRIGSVGWDAALPRMAVWADLEMRGSGDTVRVYGTHFDHRGETARLESARLILDHAQGETPTVVMGDLNATEDSAPFQAFAHAGYTSAVPVLHPSDVKGTFNGFQDADGGRRIDHILLSNGLRPVEAEIVGDPVEGVWPSDHFAVAARISATGASQLPNDAVGHTPSAVSYSPVAGR